MSSAVPSVLNKAIVSRARRAMGPTPIIVVQSPNGRILTQSRARCGPAAGKLRSVRVRSVGSHVARMPIVVFRARPAIHCTAITADRRIQKTGPLLRRPAQQAPPKQLYPQPPPVELASPSSVQRTDAARPSSMHARIAVLSAQTALIVMASGAGASMLTVSCGMTL